MPFESIENSFNKGPNTETRTEGLPEEIFIEYLEKQGPLGEKIVEEHREIKDRYKQELIKKGKCPVGNETWDELIRKETERDYVERVKERVSEDDKKLIDEFLESNDENPLPLKKRQEVLNIFFRNNYNLYANQEGEIVSMIDYLSEYYENIGVKIKIEFKIIDPNIKRNLMRKILYCEFLREKEEKENINIDFKNPNKKINDEIFKKVFHTLEFNNEMVKYILNDEIAIPYLIIETENNKIEAPLVAGGRDLFISIKSEERDESGIRKKKGLAQFQMIHSPEYGSGIQRRIAVLVHEIDHIVTENIGKVKLPKQIFEEGEDLISEATAEKAGIDFMKNQHNSSISSFNGYDYYANLEQVIGGIDLNNPHISGYIIAEAYETIKGKEAYKKLFYTGELDINKELGDIEKIKQKIIKHLTLQKEAFKQITQDKLD